MDFLLPLGHVMDENVLREFDFDLKMSSVRSPNTIMLWNRILSILGSGPPTEKLSGIAFTARMHHHCHW